MANVPAQVLEQQANMQAPGQGMQQQGKPANLANGRKTPGKGQQQGKGKAKTPSAAASLYPNLPTQE
jgi:hypothetical protein